MSVEPMEISKKWMKTSGKQIYNENKWKTDGNK